MTQTAVALRADPAFRRLLTARTLTVAGALVCAVTLPVLVYRLTSSVAWTAVVVGAEALAHLLAGPTASVLARRNVGRGGGGAALPTVLRVGAATVLLSVPLAAWASALTPAHAVLVAVGVHALLILGSGTDDRTLALIVGRDRVIDGDTAASGAAGLVLLMGPPLVGLAIAIAAPADLLVVGVVAIGLSALLVPGPPAEAVPEPRSADPVESPVRAGLRVLRGSAELRSLTAIRVAQAAGAGAWLAVLVPWADRGLGVSATGDARLALLLSSWGIGVLIAGALAPLLRRRIGPARLVLEAQLAAVAAALCVPASGHWLPTVFAVTAWGVTHGLGSMAAAELVRLGPGGHTTGPGAVVDGPAPSSIGLPLPGAARHAALAGFRLLTRGAAPMVGALLAGVVASIGEPQYGVLVAAALVSVGALVAIRSPLRASRQSGDSRPNCTVTRPDTVQFGGELHGGGRAVGTPPVCR